MAMYIRTILGEWNPQFTSAEIWCPLAIPETLGKGLADAHIGEKDQTKIWKDHAAE